MLGQGKNCSRAVHSTGVTPGFSLRGKVTQPHPTFCRPGITDRMILRLLLAGATGKKSQKNERNLHKSVGLRMLQEIAGICEGSSSSVVAVCSFLLIPRVFNRVCSSQTRIQRIHRKSRTSRSCRIHRSPWIPGSPRSRRVQRIPRRSPGGRS